MHTRRGLLAIFGGLVAVATVPAFTAPAEAQRSRAPSMPNSDTAPGPAGDLLPRAGNRRNELTRDRFGRGRRRHRRSMRHSRRGQRRSMRRRNRW